MPVTDSGGGWVSPDNPPARQRIAVVTGASRGIGAAIAAKLASQGYFTVLAARSREALQSVFDHIESVGGTGMVVPTDATVTADLDSLLDTVESRFGYLDVLINNAGTLPEAKRAEQLSLPEWQRTLDLNLTAPWYLASRAQQLLSRSVTGAVVVNVTSTAAFYPTVGFSAYNASKAGLTMVTRTLAIEWARYNIRVVGVAPGKVDTDMVLPILDYGKRRNIRVNPLHRVGNPAEVADLISYLVSDAATFITGSVISIDGGELAATGADLAR